MIKIQTRKDKTIDLARLVQVLEKEVGFEPVTEVTLELRGRLARREGMLFFEASDTGQTFAVQEVKAEGEKPPEKQVLAAVATLASPQSADRIILRQWKAEPGAGGTARQAPAASARVATAELVISGMT